METEPPLKDTIFKNMQHAIVEALNDLRPFSEYKDGSVRMKELYNRVKDAKIEVGDHIETGPHRFSIFNSALSGRRSASEIFERVEDSERHGAWWRLAKSYDECIAYALEQKGMKKVQPRARQKQDPPPQPEIAHVKPQPAFKWNKNEVLGVLDQLKELAIKTSSIREENRKLEEKLAYVSEEFDIIVNSIREHDPNSIKLAQLHEYCKINEYKKALRDQLMNSQKILLSVSDQSMDFQK